MVLYIIEETRIFSLELKETRYFEQKLKGVNVDVINISSGCICNDFCDSSIDNF